MTFSRPIVVNTPSAKQSGRIAGKAELAMEFTGIMIGDQLFPVATDSWLRNRTAKAGKLAGARPGLSQSEDSSMANPVREPVQKWAPVFRC